MKNSKLLLLTVLLGLASRMTSQAQEQTNEYLLTWSAVGYTYNAAGKLVATNLTQQTLINKVAADNGINPKDCVFVYRVEKRDTAVVWKSNGVFISDVYQMEYTYTDVTNQTGELTFRQTLLNDEYHTNAIGSTFGEEEKVYNKAGYLTGYNYHGTFQYSLPEDNVVFTGSFQSGARIYLNTADEGPDGIAN